RSGVAPGGAVGGGLQRDAVAGVGQQVTARGRPDRLGVVHVHVTGDDPGAGIAGGAELDELPLLVGAVQVGVLRQPPAVGRGPLPDLQRLAAVAVDQLHVAAAGVDDAALLVGAVVVAPLDDGCAVGRRRAVDAQANDRLAGGELVGASAAIPAR